LFGVNHKSPEVQAFVVLSYLFGPGGTEGGEAPASTRNRYPAVVAQAHRLPSVVAGVSPAVPMVSSRHSEGIR